jgi:hypothetical protein
VIFGFNSPPLKKLFGAECIAKKDTTDITININTI